MRGMKATRKVARPKPLLIAGRPVEVKTRLNPRARRLIVKVHPATGEVSVTAPSERALARALEFAHGERDWIARQLSKVPEAVALIPGARIPLRGDIHAILPGETGRGAVWTGVAHGVPTIFVAGRKEHVSRRVLDFLKREARKDLTARSDEYSARLGMRHGRVSVRDTASRWGSCSAGGALSFSWRLILAPAFVLDYVVAHEVAHLREMNHGPRFRNLVQELVGDVRAPQAWLRVHGTGLHRYAAKG